MIRLHLSSQVQAPDHWLDHERFQTAVAAASRHFSRIRKKYPDLKAYLVLSLPVGQTGIDSSAKETLDEFPTLIMDDQAKTQMSIFLKVPLSKDATDAEKNQWKERLQELTEELKYDGLCRIEIRFNELKYELVWKLQCDELVDLELTPQTRASIRIVLGTIKDFEDMVTVGN